MQTRRASFKRIFPKSIYAGIEQSKASPSSGFQFSEGGDSRTFVLPYSESNQTVLFFHMGPGLGDAGLSPGLHMTLASGISGRVHASNPQGQENFEFRGLRYQESARASLALSAYWSFAERFHPYLMYGVSYSVVKNCGRDDRDDAAGLSYGGGMLVNLSARFALSFSHKVTDLDFNYVAACSSDSFRIASFDSKIKSSGIGFALSF